MDSISSILSRMAVELRIKHTLGSEELDNIYRDLNAKLIKDITSAVQHYESMVVVAKIDPNMIISGILSALIITAKQIEREIDAPRGTLERFLREAEPMNQK